MNENTFNLSSFTHDLSDFDAATEGDPQFDTGYAAYWLRDNGDGTFTRLTSVWGVRCASWEGATAIGPFTASHAVSVLRYTDPQDPGGSEVGSDNAYYDGQEIDYAAADAEARAAHDDEVTSGSMKGLTDFGVKMVSNA